MGGWTKGELPKWLARTNSGKHQRSIGLCWLKAHAKLRQGLGLNPDLDPDLGLGRAK